MAPRNGCFGFVALSLSVQGVLVRPNTKQHTRVLSSLSKKNNIDSLDTFPDTSDVAAHAGVHRAHRRVQDTTHATYRALISRINSAIVTNDTFIVEGGPRNGRFKIIDFYPKRATVKRGHLHRQKQPPNGTKDILWNDFAPMYELDRALGKGGNGQAYLAHVLDPSSPTAEKDKREHNTSVPEVGSLVAIKLQSVSNEYHMKKFDEEVWVQEQIAAEPAPPNMMTTYSSFVIEDIGYLVMEPLSGGELWDLIEVEMTHSTNVFWHKEESEKSPSGYSKVEIVKIVRSCLADVLGFLAAISAKGFVHRDIKGANVMFVRKAWPKSQKDGGPIKCKVIDMGEAIKVSMLEEEAGKCKETVESPPKPKHCYRIMKGDEETAEIGVSGTPGFIAPEVYVSNPPGAYDVFAVGMTLIQAILTKIVGVAKVDSLGITTSAKNFYPYGYAINHEMAKRIKGAFGGTPSSYKSCNSFCAGSPLVMYERLKQSKITAKEPIGLLKLIACMMTNEPSLRISAAEAQKGLKGEAVSGCSLGEFTWSL